MIMFGIISGIKYALIASVVLVGFWAYDEYHTLQKDLVKTQANLAQSEANSALLEKEVKNQQIVLEQQIKDFEQIKKANQQLDTINKKLVVEFKQLDDKFNKINASGEKRDIGNLAVQKTRSVEKIVNRASTNALRCVEIAMGSPLTDKEKNATKKSEINSECPSIANPKYVQY